MTDANQDGYPMDHALRLGARGLGSTWPNPAVGCVIVQDQRIVGRGCTQPGGRPHAETMALAQSGNAARGASVYVTLEPCAHHGQTPPCAAALIAAGVVRVITALTDPDPRVAGKGHAMLRSAGIIVTEGIRADQARMAHAGFLKRVSQGLPFVTLKLATTLDGRIATASGESRWITGGEARRAVHALRLRHDAVMVGSGTALADDPDLTVRDLGALRQPLRVVLDGTLRHSAHSRLGQSARINPVWLLHTALAPAPAREAWQATGARLIEAAGENHISARAALEALAKEGLTRILCEGGAGLAAALVAENLVDQLVLHSAGKLIGAEGLPAIGPLNFGSLSQASQWQRTDLRTLGNDVQTVWQRV